MGAELIVITDLDGTLLDHYSYSFAAAVPALKLLEERGIPLVLCSSKTAAEIYPLRAALETEAPFIVENGAAVYLPAGDRDDDEALENVAFGMNRAEVLEILQAARIKEGADFVGFNDMTVGDIMDCTGLDEASAGNALQREFTEPVLWRDSEEKKQRFIRRVGKQGITAVQGGRFLHFAGGPDKGAAVRWLRDYYGKKWGHRPQVIALGDGENDMSMLREADFPVLVRSPVNGFPTLEREDVYRTELTGPAGWNEALLKILTDNGTE